MKPIESNIVDFHPELSRVFHRELSHLWSPRLAFLSEVPRQQIVKAALRVAVGNRGQGSLEIWEGFDTLDLAGFD